jgi:hypothetical protein
VIVEAANALRYLIRPPVEAAARRHNRPAFATPLAYRHLLAIGYQESRLVETKQLGAHRKPLEHLARGWWQFESGGGVHGVLTHPAAAWCRTEIVELGYPLHNRTLHWALAYDQRLAVVMARALLWTDPHPLPEDEGGAWALYMRTWRPGKAKSRSWPDAWRLASDAVQQEERGE